MSAVLTPTAPVAQPEALGHMARDFTARVNRESNSKWVDSRLVPLNKRQVVCFEYGSTCGDTGQYIAQIAHLLRKGAAEELRWLRKRGAYIERRNHGYYIEVTP